MAVLMSVICYELFNQSGISFDLLIDVLFNFQSLLFFCLVLSIVEKGVLLTITMSLLILLVLSGFASCTLKLCFGCTHIFILVFPFKSNETGAKHGGSNL
jgi:hypothetical protein